MSFESKSRFLKTSLALSLTITTVAAGLAEVGQRLANIADHPRQQEKQRFEQEQGASLARAQEFAAAGNYLGCIAETEKVQVDATVYPQAQVYNRHCQNQLAAAWLEQAKQRATQGDLAGAIGDAGQVAGSSDYYDEAQQMIQDYSGQLFEQAESHYWQPVDQLEQALAIISAIPTTSPTFEKALKQSQEWRQTWTDNTRYLSSARQALAQEQWTIALSEAQQVTDHPFWLPQKNTILQAIQDQQQQQYAEQLEIATVLLERNETANAIVVAQQLPDAFPWSERKQQLIARAKAKQRQIGLCQQISLGFLSCYESAGIQSP